MALAQEKGRLNQLTMETRILAGPAPTVSATQRLRDEVERLRNQCGTLAKRLEMSGHGMDQYLIVECFCVVRKIRCHHNINGFLIMSCESSRKLLNVEVLTKRDPTTFLSSKLDCSKEVPICRRLVSRKLQHKIIFDK